MYKKNQIPNQTLEYNEVWLRLYIILLKIMTDVIHQFIFKMTSV